MLQLKELYNFLEYEYNEDLDYIDDIYNFLQIIRLVQENENENLILEKMELLEEGIFIQLKNENIDIDILHKLYKKYLSQKNDLELNINNSLNQYNKNIDDIDNPYPYDTSDLKQVKKRKTKVQLEQERMDEELRVLVNTEGGAYFIWRLFEQCRMYNSADPGEMPIERFEGRRDVGLWLLGELVSIDEKLYTMIRNVGSNREGEK